jgi:hypothetical protein
MGRMHLNERGFLHSLDRKLDEILEQLGEMQIQLDRIESENAPVPTGLILEIGPATEQTT